MGDELDAAQVSRRRFLGYVIGGISGLIAAAVATPVAGYFLSPAWKKSKASLIPIARIDEIPEGEPQFVTYEERIRDG